MSFQKTKLDPELGERVHQHLLSLGLETPLIKAKLDVDAKEKIRLIEKSAYDICETLGYDLTDDSIEETPKRIAKMMVLETMWGLHPENFPKCTTVANKISYGQMVLEKGVRISSVCEHHWQNIFGSAYIAYIPNEKVLGLSKLNRIAEYFSRRGQIQERLTMQILETLKFVLESEHVAVVIDSEHFCVKARGVEDQESSTITSALSGAFKDDVSTRNEFMSFVNSAIAAKR